MNYLGYWYFVDYWIVNEYTGKEGIDVEILLN
jgi:hypothetical protein